MRLCSALPIWLLCVLASSGCDLPHDSAGTLERVRNGEIRVGITANEPWARFDERSKAAAGGVEVRLVEEFAGELNSEIVWRQDSESDLFEALRNGELDLVIGGLTDSTPFADKAGLTQPYVELGKQKHIWAVRPGENALLLQVDEFLQARKPRIGQMLAEESPP